MEALNKTEGETPTNLFQKTASGVGWRMVGSWIGVFSSFVFSVALARILPPEDFGIIGMALIVTSFVYTFRDFGLGQALIQRREITDGHIRTCFTMALMMGIGITGIMIGSAGLVAGFFSDERVAPVLRVLAVSSLFAALAKTSTSLLYRRLQFRTTVAIELVSNIIGYGGVSVVMALMGYGYWSLVGGIITQNALQAALAYLAVRHSLRPYIGKTESRDLLGFGGAATANEMLNFFALKGDYIIIGRVMDAVSLGFYTRAYALMELPLAALGQALSRVLFPAASRAQSDIPRFRRAYQASLTLSIAVSLPLSLFVAIFAREIIAVVYGEVWLATIPILQVLCLFGMFRMSYNTASAFVRASGKMGPLVFSNAVYAVMVIVGSIVGATVAGLTGVAWMVGIAIAVMWTLAVAFANRAADINLMQCLNILALGALPGMILAGGVWLGVSGLRMLDLSPLWILVLLGPVVAALFVIIVVWQARMLKHPAIDELLRMSFSRARAMIQRSRQEVTA